MKKLKIRSATINDLPFLKLALYWAVFWNPKSKRMSMDELFTEHEIAKILDGWGKRDGDFALIANDDQDNPIGAVWSRFWTKKNHSYGFYDEETPEIGIAVLEEYRGMGIGTKLIQKIVKHAQQQKIEKLSLSVEANNYAVQLYEEFGFKKVDKTDNSWTMVKTL